jgi:hypothetical protein
MCFQFGGCVVPLEAAGALRALKKGSYRVHLVVDLVHVSTFPAFGSEGKTALHASPMLPGRCVPALMLCVLAIAETLPLHLEQDAGMEVNEALFSVSLLTSMCTCSTNQSSPVATMMLGHGKPVFNVRGRVLEVGGVL